MKDEWCVLRIPLTNCLKRDSPLSVGTRGESRGATQVKRVALNKIPCVITGKISQRHFSGTPFQQVVENGYTLAL
jgi:hypothetical protein